MTENSRVTPCLWFVDRFEEAMEFYVGLLPNSAIGAVQRMPDGSVVSAEWTLDGQPFRGIQGGPTHPPTPAFSISVSCADQAEVDRLWDALIADGGSEGNCAWLVDRFGVSWQIVPDQLPQLLGDPDPARSQAALQAMLKMNKIVVADLEAAADAAG